MSSRSTRPRPPPPRRSTRTTTTARPRSARWIWRQSSRRHSTHRQFASSSAARPTPQSRGCCARSSCTRWRSGRSTRSLGSATTTSGSCAVRPGRSSQLAARSRRRCSCACIRLARFTATRAPRSTRCVPSSKSSARGRTTATRSSSPRRLPGRTRCATCRRNGGGASGDCAGRSRMRAGCPCRRACGGGGATSPSRCAPRCLRCVVASRSVRARARVTRLAASTHSAV